MDISFFNRSYVIYSVTLTILLLLIVKLAIPKFIGKSGKTKKKKYHPVGGTIFNQFLNFNRIYNYMTDLGGKYQTYRILNLFNSEVYTSDPANVEYILKTNFENYGKGPYNYSRLSDLLGDGIFTVDGDKWRQQRKISSHEFSTRVLRDHSSVVLQKKAAKLASIISTAAKTDQTLDIQDLFVKCTMDSIFKIALGIELDNMCGLSQDGARFGDAFNQCSALTLFRYVDVLWKIKRFFNIGSERVLLNNLKVVDDFVNRIINNKNNQTVASEDDSSGYRKQDILSRFMLVEKEPKYLRDIILSFIIAGSDTTAVTLSWFIYMVCRHPNVEEKLVHEIKMVMNLKEATDFTEFAYSLSENSLEKMQYLHAALSETLRLYPAVPVDGKFCFNDDIFPDGMNVKKGSVVLYQPYVMGRMKSIWGDDAESFRPERWIDENGCFRHESPFKFTAFQAGPRICLGKEFAYMQMKIFAAVLLWHFKFKLKNENEAVSYKPMITLHINDGLHVRAIPR